MATQSLHVFSNISAEGQDCKDVPALHHLLILKNATNKGAPMLFVGWDEGSVPLTQHGGKDKGAIQLSTPVSTN